MRDTARGEREEGRRVARQRAPPPVEVFVPADLTEPETRRYLHAQIQEIANEGGDFVAEVRLGTKGSEVDGWCKWSAEYLPGPPGTFPA